MKKCNMLLHPSRSEEIWKHHTNTQHLLEINKEEKPQKEKNGYKYSKLKHVNVQNPEC